MSGAPEMTPRVRVQGCMAAQQHDHPVDPLAGTKTPAASRIGDPQPAGALRAAAPHAPCSELPAARGKTGPASSPRRDLRLAAYGAATARISTRLLPGSSG
jgi:hypothetical protein